MYEFLHDTGVGVVPMEGSGEAVPGGPVLECAVGDARFDFLTVKCCDVTNSMNL